MKNQAKKFTSIQKKKNFEKPYAERYIFVREERYVSQNVISIS